MPLFARGLASLFASRPKTIGLAVNREGGRRLASRLGDMSPGDTGYLERQLWNSGITENVEDDVWYTNFVSSNIEAIKYQFDTQSLFVKFWGGGEYQYLGVPIELAHEFINWTGSKGRFFYENIRGTPEQEPLFPFIKIS